MNDSKAQEQFENTIARKWFERLRWEDGVSCPTCHNLHGIYARNCLEGYHRCQECNRDFTVRHHSVMRSSHVPYYKWVQAIEWIRDGGSMKSELAEKIGVTKTTASRLIKRIEDGKVSTDQNNAFFREAVRLINEGEGI